METCGDDRREGNCNTKIPLKKDIRKRENQLTNWFFTFNNYTADDILLLETKFKTICKKYVFQEEIGLKCGTPHLQGSIHLKK